MEDGARVVIAVGVLVTISTDSRHGVTSLWWRWLLILLAVVDVGLLLDRLSRVVILRRKVLASQQENLLVEAANDRDFRLISCRLFLLAGSQCGGCRLLFATLAN